MEVPTKSTKGGKWTLLEDYFLLEGFIEKGKKWNLIKEYMQTIGHLSVERSEKQILERWKNISKTNGPYSDDFVRKKWKKPIQLDATKHQQTIMKLQLQKAEEEQEQETLFLENKKMIIQIKGKNKILSSDSIDLDTEVSEDLKMVGEERKQQRLEAKKLLLSSAQLDNSLKEKISECTYRKRGINKKKNKML